MAVAAEETGGMCAPSEPPLVVAVVLTWNDVDMAARCLESLRCCRYGNLKAVLVDNGSSFPTIPPLREQFPEVEMVGLSENFGFTGGCNRGIEKALEMGAEGVFLLNNDTIVQEDAVCELVKAMDARPDAAMTSAVLLYPGEDKRIQSHCVWPNRERAYGRRVGVGELLAEDRREILETGFAPACAVLYRASALKEVGLFDESFFTNWEDYDLCMRFVDAGFKMYIVESAEVVHAHGQTTGLTSPFITYYSVRNRLVCLFRYGSRSGIIFGVPFFLRSLWWQVKRYGVGNMECHRALVRGVFDFLLGVRGKAGGPTSRDDTQTGKKA